MAGKGKTHKRTLIVTGQKPMATVGTKSGGQSTLYEVYATTPEGELVEEPLRAFTELEEGVPIEYSVERYNHPKYGTSYTLTPPPRNTARRVRQLEEELEALRFWAGQQGFDAEKSKREIKESEAVSTEAPDRPDLDERFGKDVPWTDEGTEECQPDSDGNSGELEDLEWGAEGS